ncbi:hypothetical protein CEXT_144321 [Caerostris extrusa]|uniref:Uncharacterized protein n=1 Tax=Caerostris extrusa TaxID=172846 RepID=A0AAV4Y580_CAEEX|nr:hypothetical protein CEXT_144321 [Caerostris extrusa]
MPGSELEPEQLHPPFTRSLAGISSAVIHAFTPSQAIVKVVKFFVCVSQICNRPLLTDAHTEGIVESGGRRSG